MTDGVFLGRLAVVDGDVVIADNVEIAAGAVLDGTGGRILVRHGARIGANATVIGPAVLERGCRVRPGAVVGGNVPALAIVAGNPAVIVGYADTHSAAMAPPAAEARAGADRRGGGARLVEFTEARDLRGNLAVGEFASDVPFSARRFFVVYGVPGQHVRGAHAHHVCEQFLIAVAGQVSVVTDDGAYRDEVLLDRPSIGLYIPPMTWGVQYKHSADAVLVVFASHPYDPDDYIRDYDEFIELTTRHR